MPEKVKETPKKLRLFHFSEEQAITEFMPRRPHVLPQRPDGQEWLNDALVWAIEDDFQFLYLFPRNCPRILIWTTPHTAEEDRKVWMGCDRFNTHAVAYIETDWMVQLESAGLYRYELPVATFQNLDDAGMWVSRSYIRPIRTERLINLPDRLAEMHVEVRTVEFLPSIQHVMQSTLRVSGIRLRNAKGWRAQFDQAT
jgi:hypothetical protein